MIKTGKIINSADRKGIPYASVEITDVNGNYLGAGVSADVAGNFSIDTLMMQPGTFMRISSVGYSTISVPYVDYINRAIFTLNMAYTSEPPIVITYPKNPTDGTGEKLLWGAGILALFFLLKKN